MLSGRGTCWKRFVTGQNCTTSSFRRVASQNGAVKFVTMGCGRFHSAAGSVTTLASRLENHHVADRPVARVRDTAYAGDPCVRRPADLPRAAVVEELPDRLDGVEPAAGKPRLPGRDLAASGVDRQRSTKRDIRIADEACAAAAAGEADMFELQHHGDQKVVVGVKHPYRGGSDAGLGERTRSGD